MKFAPLICILIYIYELVGCVKVFKHSKSPKFGFPFTKELDPKTILNVGIHVEAVLTSMDGTGGYQLLPQFNRIYIYIYCLKG